MIVPKHYTRGKLAKYRGLSVRLTKIDETQFGPIVKISSIDTAPYTEPKFMNLSEFNLQSERFYSILTWTNEKRTEGYKLFNFLRTHNPLFLQKEKRWKLKYISTSKIGDYFIANVNVKSGKMKDLNGENCIFITTFNSGNRNGYMVIPLQ